MRNFRAKQKSRSHYRTVNDAVWLARSHCKPLGGIFNQLERSGRAIVGRAGRRRSPIGTFRPVQRSRSKIFRLGILEASLMSPKYWRTHVGRMKAYKVVSAASD